MESKFAPKVFVTVHPSSILRAPDEAAREREYRQFVRDLSKLVIMGTDPSISEN